MGETRVQSVDQEDLLEKGMAIHSSIFAREIPCTEEPGEPHSSWSCKELDMTKWLTHTTSTPGKSFQETRNRRRLPVNGISDRFAADAVKVVKQWVIPLQLRVRQGHVFSPLLLHIFQEVLSSSIGNNRHWNWKKRFKAVFILSQHVCLCRISYSIKRRLQE